MEKRKTTKKSSKKSKKNRSSLYFLKPITAFLSTSKIYFIIGAILILISGSYHLYEITKYSFTAPPIEKQTKIHRLPHPTHISIQYTDMDFSVVDTVIQHGVWQIADSGISHLGISANPGENGTIIIYGHNTLVRFGSLPFVSQGQEVTLTTADNKKHTYIIQKTEVVDPTDTKILTGQKGEVLLLYTCYGFADLQRFIVLAYPKK